ncbi:cocoonase-like protein, partial [Leptotrombidium deliense]
IIGGTEVPDHKYPWMTYLVTRICGQYYGCGGSIIDERHVLTAAHCVHGADLALYRVGSNLEVDYLNETTGAAECYFAHENYTTDTYQNDVAVIRLKKPLRFSYTVRPVCVAPRRLKIDENKNITIVGWGVTENGTTTKELRETNVTYYNFNECNESWGGIVNNIIQFCASDPGHGPCFGDSGGPAMQKHYFRNVIFGVTSYIAVPCATYRNSVYGYVPGFYEWIQSKVRHRCDHKLNEKVNVQRSNVNPKRSFV